MLRSMILTLATITSTAFCGEKIAVIGCGGSSTSYITKILTSNGLDITNNKKGKDGCASSYLAPVVTKEEYPTIIHQVRHPLKVIEFAQKMSYANWRYYSKYIPEIANKDSWILKSAKYWYYWNLLAESKAAYTYRIENLESELPKLGSLLHKNLVVNPNIDQKSNKIKKTDLTWDKLKSEIDPELYDKIVNLASRYGYDVPN